ncbi:hypothetical protein KFL_004630100 [Klebsormidium nitens]|uniref:Uncharacterized protein n=1 Tax=Klebsormidium nitens TaxID=105231 RepID=A0A1Y1IFM2_KLENI|nr:hypothetical protein KFL_004630100 [Klebsormidium nitens]|eukprot:GAQ88842.1 hypothetical protein KFL_004630100 [Klebsormidium nitens]
MIRNEDRRCKAEGTRGSEGGVEKAKINGNSEETMEEGPAGADVPTRERSREEKAGKPRSRTLQPPPQPLSLALAFGSLARALSNRLLPVSSQPVIPEGAPCPAAVGRNRSAARALGPCVTRGATPIPADRPAAWCLFSLRMCQSMFTHVKYLAPGGPSQAEAMAAALRATFRGRMPPVCG